MKTETEFKKFKLLIWSDHFWVNLITFGHQTEHDQQNVSMLQRLFTQMNLTAIVNFNINERNLCVFSIHTKYESCVNTNQQFTFKSYNIRCNTCLTIQNVFQYNISYCNTIDADHAVTVLESYAQKIYIAESNCMWISGMTLSKQQVKIQPV